MTTTNGLGLMEEDEFLVGGRRVPHEIIKELV
jgi:hypothetical protein